MASYYLVIFVACVSTGLAAGALRVWGAVGASTFGPQSCGLARGLIGPIITLFVMMGFPLVGRLCDVTASFSLDIWISAALVAVAASLLVPIRLSKES